MGLIRSAIGATGGVLADQWLEFFYCDSLAEDVMAVKGQKRISGRSSNTKGEDNIISDGSGIAVADGQCMIIVEQGKILDFCAEPGQFTFRSGGEPSLFAGEGFKENALGSLRNVFDRFKLGGSPGRDTRVYYFNTKELIGNKYGTPSPVPFRVVDQNIGLDIDISIRCHGEYSYRIVNPMLFYTNVCGNVAESYTRETIDGQLKTELMTALQPAFAKISTMGIRYSALPGHAMELADALNEVLSAKWRDLRGLEIAGTMAISQIKAKFMATLWFMHPVAPLRPGSALRIDKILIFVELRKLQRQEPVPAARASAKHLLWASEQQKLMTESWCVKTLNSPQQEAQAPTASG